MGSCSSGQKADINLKTITETSAYSETIKYLLDKWRASDVQILRKRFSGALPSGSAELDINGFYRLFSGLLEYVTRDVVDSAFRIFDAHSRGSVSFRDFCCALAICCMSPVEERMRFIFDMFDTDDDGVLSRAEILRLLEATAACRVCAPTRRRKSEWAEQRRIEELQWATDQRSKMLPNGENCILFLQFLEWSMEHESDVTELLSPFQLVPNVERERQMCQKLWAAATEFEEETWYVMSSKWVQVWRRYAMWGEAGARNDGLVEIPNASEPRERPREIDNSDFESEFQGELKWGLVEGHDYELVPESLVKRWTEWYGGGPPFPRKVIQFADKRPQVEMYPHLVLVNTSDETKAEQTRRFFVSRTGTVEQVVYHVCQIMLKRPEATRVWYRRAGEAWRVIDTGTEDGARQVLDELDSPMADAPNGPSDTLRAFLLETVPLLEPVPEPPPVPDSLSSMLCMRLDARAPSGRWYTATVVDMRDGSLKIHFSGLTYKHDEWFPVGSPRLAAFRTHTGAESPESRRNSLNDVAADSEAVARGATGLENLGNTCFLNCMVQVLGHTPLYRDYIVEHHGYGKNLGNHIGSRPAVDELAKLFNLLWAGDSAFVSPVAFKRWIDKNAPQFSGYEQHDSQELLSFLLDAVHSELNRAQPVAIEPVVSAVPAGHGTLGTHPKRMLRTGRKGRRRLSGTADVQQHLDGYGSGPDSGPRFLDGNLRSDLSEDGAHSESSASESSASTRSGRSGRQYKVIRTTHSAHTDLTELAEMEEVDEEGDDVPKGTRRGPVAFLQSISPKPRRWGSGRPKSKKEKPKPAADTPPPGADAAAAAHTPETPDMSPGVTAPQDELTTKLNSKDESSSRDQEETGKTEDQALAAPGPPMAAPVKGFGLFALLRGRAAMQRENGDEDGEAEATRRGGMFSRMVKRKSRNPPEPEMEADVRRFPFWLRRKKAPRNQYEGDADDEDENNEDEEDEIDQVKAQREWEAYREKNISIVVDLFEGQLRSTLTCCNCARRSSRFEPFRFLSVPVPIQPDRPFDITLVSLRAGEPMLVKYSVLVAKDCLVEAALDALSDQLPVPAASLVLAEVYLHRISRYIPPHIELSEIRSEDAIYAYVVSQSIEEIRGVQHRDSARGSWPSEQEEQRRLSVASVETNEAGERESWASEKEELISLEIIHRRLAELNRTPEKTVTKREIFGLPLLSAVGSWFTFEQLHEHLQQIAALYAGASGVPLPHVRVVSANGQETGQVLPESGPMRLRGPRVHLAFDWDMPFDVQVMEHPSVEAVQHQLAAIGREKLLELSDCLDAFVAPEFLGDGNKVYCSKCKSQQRVRKQIDIWREPDILIVHIKRFQFNGTCFEKLGQHIEPPEEFDLGKWIAKRDEYVVEGAIYTLYGIATHHGGLSGGHYFSTCANSAGDETTWYKFNDTVVTKYTPEEFKAASSHRQGYVLFYRKQNLSASNLINYALVAPRPDVQTPPEQSGRLWSA